MFFLFQHLFGYPFFQIYPLDWHQDIFVCNKNNFPTIRIKPNIFVKIEDIFGFSCLFVMENIPFMVIILPAKGG